MQKSNEVLTIKPYKDNYIAWVVSVCLLFDVVLIIGIIVDACYERLDLRIYAVIFVAIFAGVSLIALIARLCYRGKLIVTADGVIKLHGKKVQFKIKREDIVSVCVRKMNPVLKLLVILSAFIGDICTDLIFFRFYHAEQFEERRFDGVIIQRSLSEEDDKNLREFAESVTYNQAVKICKLLDIPYKIIKN